MLSQKNYPIQISTVVLLAFFSAFLSRLADTLGAPSPINFLHFATIPLAFLLALSSANLIHQKQRQTILWLLVLMFAFLLIILASTLINTAGLVNAVLAFLLWVEPFLLLVAVLCLPTSLSVVKQLRKWITYALFCHTLMAFVQQYVLKYHLLRGAQDNIQGIFYRSGAGHVVGASVALVFGIYYLLSATRSPLWLRIAVLAATFWHMILADAKQVLLSLLIGSVLLFLFRLKNIVKVFQYSAVGIVVCGFLYWCIENLDAFRAFKTWMRPEIYSPDGEATLLKFAAFRIIPTFYHSPLNELIGLGPGHTVDRLGGWMLAEYQSLFVPLGATTHPASVEVWRAVGASWLGDKSSAFSPLFGWAALWGDFGIFGLGIYVAMGIVVYRTVCTSDISKLILLNVFAVGWIFSQLQEPTYMLSMTMIIGLDWQEHQLARAFKRKRKRQPRSLYLDEGKSDSDLERGVVPLPTGNSLRQSLQNNVDSCE